MINKFYRGIHNKYSTLFKFIFFLRYLFVTFFISIALFLLIPHFFDFKKKDGIIKTHLLKNYSLNIINYESIKYNSLPIPNIEIINASSSLNSDSVKLDTEKLKIYPKLINIYNFKDFEAKKIILNKNNLSLNTNELKILSNYIYELKNKITINDLELKILREDKLLTNIQKISFSNYGYKKNIIRGQLFKKKFKIKIENSFKEINFKLLNTGINIDFDFKKNKKNFFSTGVIKAKVLNSNLKLDFEHNEKKIKIDNVYFRNKELSFNNNSIITYNPFFSIISNYSIEDINIKLFENLNLNKILRSKSIIKKINSNNVINYKSKKFSRNLIDDLNFNIDLSYGRLIYLTTFLISNNSFNCKGDSNLLDEYPILYFNCSIRSEDKKSLLNFFLVKYKTKNQPFNLDIDGNLNLLNNKINFYKINMNKDYVASKEDLKYFKDTFESVLFNEDFKNIFNLNKIKEFILEIS
jgi:hypothetical protein